MTPIQDQPPTPQEIVAAQKHLREATADMLFTPMKPDSRWRVWRSRFRLWRAARRYFSYFERIDRG